MAVGLNAMDRSLIGAAASRNGAASSRNAADLSLIDAALLENRGFNARIGASDSRFQLPRCGVATFRALLRVPGYLGRRSCFTLP